MGEVQEDESQAEAAGDVETGLAGVGVGAVCRMDPLVAVPHTTMRMGVDSFTKRTGVRCTCGPISP